VLGTGIGLHNGAEAAAFVRSGSLLTTIVAMLHSATPPYIDWVILHLERFVQEEFFRDPAHLQALVMCNLPPLPVGIEAFAAVRPRQRVSGDLVFCDFHDDNVWFGVGDATGHGVAAGLFSGTAHLALHRAVHNLRTQVQLNPLTEAMCQLNADLHLGRAGNMGLAGVFCRVVFNNDVIEALNCGSPAAPFLLRNGEACQLNEGGPTLGYFPKIEINIWRSKRQPGDVIVLSSDGLVEQKDPTGELFSNQRMATRLQAAPSTEPRELAEYIFSCVDAFAAGTSQGDDQALLIVRLA
jgi:serine phosphatase RsbU (regulator of sigma subunit)